MKAYIYALQETLKNVLVAEGTLGPSSFSLQPRDATKCLTHALQGLQAFDTKIC